MAKKLAFINGKGGVGKTTSIFHVCGELAKRGERVLVVDLDKQCNTSWVLTMNGEQPEHTLYDFFCGSADPAVCTVPVLFQIRSNAEPKFMGVDVMVSDSRFETITENDMVSQELIGKKMEDFVKEQGYTWVLYDMPPSHAIFNELCFNYLTDHVIVPFSSDYFSLQGYQSTVEKVYDARKINPKINILGIYLSRYWGICAAHRHVRDVLLENPDFAAMYIDNPIPMAADVIEAVMFGRPLCFYKPTTEKSPAKRAFETLVDEIYKRTK